MRGECAGRRLGGLGRVESRGSMQAESTEQRRGRAATMGSGACVRVQSADDEAVGVGERRQGRRLRWWEMVAQ